MCCCFSVGSHDEMTSSKSIIYRIVYDGEMHDAKITRISRMARIYRYCVRLARNKKKEFKLESSFWSE
jgi:hypothetical protein